MRSARGLRLDVVLAGELSCLGSTLEPAFLKDRRDVGVRDEVVEALLVPVEDYPDPAIVIGIAKDVRTLLPCCLRFSAPLVEKVPQKRSKSSIFTVDKTNSILLHRSFHPKCCAALTDRRAAHGFRTSSRCSRIKLFGLPAQPVLTLPRLPIPSRPDVDPSHRAYL